MMVRHCAAMTVALAFALAFHASPLASQQPGERPRIGLVLGGGGARGGAHAGVLRVLEQLRVPIDAIAGTSMGAIVGGLYASGMDAGSIEQVLRDTDWNRVFAARSARRDVEYRRKQDDRHLLVDFELGYRDGRFRLPGGVIGSQAPALMLQLLTLPVSDVDDFDQLPIPFRAVATDIGTGEPVVLRGGSLARALRASMSIPGAFAPVTIDDRLLIDGGVVRNLPIDAVREMDVDIIIAVDVGTPLAEIGDLDSALGVYAQTLTIFTRGNTEAQLRTLHESDVVITPALADVSSVDFHRIGAAIDAGLAAAHDAAPALRPLALDSATWLAHRRTHERRAWQATIDFVRVDNDTRYSTRSIEGRLRIAPGDTVETDRIATEVEQIHALGVFERVEFEIVRENDSTGLIVRPTEKPWGPNFLRFGLGFIDAPDANSGFDLIANYTMTGVGRLDADVRIEAQVGSTRRLFTEYYQPLTASGRFFIAPALTASQHLASAVQQSIRIASYDTERIGVSFDAGQQFGSFGQIRFGVRREWIDAEPEIGQPDLPEFSVAQTAIGARFAFDQLDDAAFPSHGTAGAVRIFRANRGVDPATHHALLEGNLVVAGSAGPHTIVASVEAGSGLGTQLPLHEEFALGGFLRLSGLRRQEITGSSMALARIMYFNRTGSGGAFGLTGGLRIGGSLEVGNTWPHGEASLGSLRAAASVFVALDSVLGPLFFAYGSADRNRRGWYFFLGQAIW